MDRVKGKVALVTGGAQGSGRAISNTLAREGAKLVVADINEATVQTVDEIKTFGGEAIYIKHDVRDEESLEKSHCYHIKQFRQIGYPGQ